MSMRKRPDLTPEQQRAADSFIEGADRADGAARQSESGEQPGSREVSARQGAEGGPWEEPRVREDVKKNYPLRLPEPLYLKLKFVSKQTGRSMNRICNEAVEASVEAEIDRLRSKHAR